MKDFYCFYNPSQFVRIINLSITNGLKTGSVGYKIDPVQYKKPFLIELAVEPVVEPANSHIFFSS